jgi:hypothetical protein
MTIRRNRPSRLNTAGDVASEHAEVWRKLKRGKLDPSLASRMSAILVNHTPLAGIQLWRWPPSGFGTSH